MSDYRYMYSARPWRPSGGVPVDEQRLRAMRAMDVLTRARSEGKPSTAAERMVLRDGAITVVRIGGAMVADPMAGFWGELYAPDVAEALRMAAADPSRAVVLDVDCPGGDVALMSDVIDAAAALARAKPLYAIAHDTALSGAYWLASLAREISATPTAMVGSIGVLAQVLDQTKRLSEEGLVIEQFATGDLKGLSGAVGLSDAQRDLIRQTLMDHYGLFAASVAERRSGKGVTREAIDALRGASLTAVRALEAGLVDHVEPYQAALARYRALASGLPLPSLNPGAPVTTPTPIPTPTPTPTPAPMPAPPTMPNLTPSPGATGLEAPAAMRAATAGELKAAGIDADLGFHAIEQGWTLAQAQTEQISRLRAAAAAAAAAAPKANAGPASPPRPQGPAMYGAGGGGGGEGPAAFARYEDAFAAARTGGLDLTKAHAQVAQRHPDLHRDWVARGCPGVERRNPAGKTPAAFSASANALR